MKKAINRYQGIDRVASFACVKCGVVHTAPEGYLLVKRYTCAEVLRTACPVKP